MEDRAQTQIKERVTYSLFDAAYLLHEHIPFVGLIPGARVGFRFSDEDGKATEALHRWHEPGLMISASTYVGAYRSVRGLVFSAKGRG